MKILQNRTKDQIGENDVKLWQQFLQSLNFYKGTIDGDFGSNSESATKLFQTQHGLLATGIVDTVTYIKAAEFGFGKINTNTNTKRIHLWDPGTAGLHIPTLRAAAVSIAQYACNGKQGRVLGDPVFEEVTEKRAHAKGYSSCGDLVHFVLKNLGCRDEALVNRTDDGGKKPWRIGLNISMIVYGAKRAWRTRTDLSASGGNIRPQTGDPCLIAKLAPSGSMSNEHVFVIEDMVYENTKLVMYSYDYGQFNIQAGKPSGERKRRIFIDPEKGTFEGSDRVLIGWLDISKLDYIVSATVPVNFVGGVPDDNPYYSNITL